MLIPFEDKVSVSSKIKSSEERARLKQLIQSIKPKNFGVIVRTVAEGKRVAELDKEMEILDGQQINTANPASYSAIDSLTALFDLGVSLYNGNYEMGNLKQNAKNTSFDYFAFQFRARKNVGITVGILPYSNINYSFSSSAETLKGNETVTSSYSFTGNGGIHKVFLGAGWRILKPISIGVNGSFLFG